jgi:tRNA(adenine34) deaminase
MRYALDLAQAAAARGDVPVGAVVVLGDRVIGIGANRREIDHDPTGHAEIVALREAGRWVRRWRIDGATLYATLEPCPMCAGALVNARVARLVYGAADPKAGAVETLFRLCDDPRLNHRLEIVGGVLAVESSEILQAFFRDARQRQQAKLGRNKHPSW